MLESQVGSTFSGRNRLVNMNLLHATCDKCDFGWAGPAFKDFIVRDGKLAQLGFRVGEPVGLEGVLRFFPKLCQRCCEVTFVYDGSSNEELIRCIQLPGVENISAQNCCFACGNTSLWSIEVSGMLTRRQECPKCKNGRLHVKRSIAV